MTWRAWSEGRKLQYRQSHAHRRSQEGVIPLSPRSVASIWDSVSASPLVGPHLTRGPRFFGAYVNVPFAQCERTPGGLNMILH